MADELTGKPPMFGGSTGGLLTKAEVEEKYAITWTSSKEQVFEMKRCKSLSLDDDMLFGFLFLFFDLTDYAIQ